MKHRTDFYEHKWASRQDWQRYEDKKKELERKNLTPMEYEREVRRIAKECGV